MSTFEEQLAEYREEVKHKPIKKIHRNRYWAMLQDGFIHEYTPLLDELNRQHPDEMHAEYLKKKMFDDNIIEDVSTIKTVQITNDVLCDVTSENNISCIKCDKYLYLRSIMSDNLISIPEVCATCGAYKNLNKDNVIVTPEVSV